MTPCRRMTFDLPKLAAVLGFLFALGPAVSCAQAPPPVPALPDTERRTSYNISGTTCACGVGFQLYGSGTDVDSWLQVWVNGIRKLSTDVNFGWRITSPSGPIGALARPITNAVLTFNSVQTGNIQIVGAERPRRLSEFAENRGVAARDLNQTLNDVAARQREIWDKTTRGLFGLPGESISPMPSAAQRANKFMLWDSTGTVPLVAGAVPGSSGVVGPATSIIGNLAVWQNTTGTLLGDAGTSDVYFGSGRPWCDVRAHGAKGDAVTDDWAAFQACLTVLANTGPAFFNGGILFIPPGNYCVSQTIDTTVVGNTPVTIMGSGRNPSTVQTCGVDITVLNLNGHHSRIDNMQFAGNGFNGGGGVGTVAGVTHPAVILDTLCAGCRIEQSSFFAGTIPLLIKAVDAYVGYALIAQGYGAASVQITNPASLIAAHFVRTQIDSPMVGTAPTTPSAWQANHAYSTNDIVSLGGFYIQATSTGTSANSSPTLQPFTIAIADNTVTWTLLGPVAYCGLSVESGAFEVQLTDVDLSNTYGTAALCMSNDLAGSAPGLVKIHNSVLSNNLGPYTIYLKAGTGFTLTSSEVFGCVPIASCIGVNIPATFTGVTIFANNYFGVQAKGIVLLAPKATITGNIFGTIGGSNGTGIEVGAGISDFTITGNYFDNVTGTAILIDGGASDRYTIMGNSFSTTVSTAVADGGTGIVKMVDFGSHLGMNQFSLFSSTGTIATTSAGEIGFPKIAATGVAPGAGFVKIEAVAGTAGGSCKIIAYAGTSNTPVTILDNIGAGC